MTQPRSPKGVPSGGQFSESPRSEPGLDLGKTDTCIACGATYSFTEDEGSCGFCADCAVQLGDEMDSCVECGTRFGDGEGDSSWGTCAACTAKMDDGERNRDRARQHVKRAGDIEGLKTMRQFVDEGVVTPNGVVAWRAARDEWSGGGAPDGATLRELQDLDEIVDYLETRAAEDGTAINDSELVVATHMLPRPPASVDEMWESYTDACDAEGPMRPDEWVYRHGQDFGAFQVPAPPVGAEIDEGRARSLPGYTEIQATFEHMPDKSFHLMARDIARWDANERDKDLSRRFTNLDTGTEIFVGGKDTPDGYGHARIVRATVTKRG